MTVCYDTLKLQLQGLLEGESDWIANLANASALLWMSLPDINWVGFYLRRGDQLVLGPFQGKPACTRIAMGVGVCGTAATANQSQRVADVHQFDGHIACDTASNSELVVPIANNDQVVAVLDIDSPQFGRFSEADQQGMEQLAALLAKVYPG
ncbi:GAF domain-containing protein [Porticoccus sp. W117]|uniref:GAF domain-containing protein n=1 Tax=Porticoccus sp. W117 TaxID=3054777 RepID=UPI002593501C|nr:GAF domain-containing protein [Porticoccus sp. W117]MDM3871891.1 GAF domain-containing protein [Porticoccus sp. W117]